MVGRGLLAKQLIGPAGCKRRTVRAKPIQHIIFSRNLSNFHSIGDRPPCAFDSEHTLYVSMHCVTNILKKADFLFQGSNHQVKNS